MAGRGRRYLGWKKRGGWHRVQEAHLSVCTRPTGQHPASSKTLLENRPQSGPHLSNTHTQDSRPHSPGLSLNPGLGSPCPPTGQGGSTGSAKTPWGSCQAWAPAALDGGLGSRPGGACRTPSLALFPAVWPAASWDCTPAHCGTRGRAVRRSPRPSPPTLATDLSHRVLRNGCEVGGGEGEATVCPGVVGVEVQGGLLLPAASLAQVQAVHTHKPVGAGDDAHGEGHLVQQRVSRQ